MNVLLVGESWTVHETHMKGFDIFNVCRHEEHCGDMLADVLRREGFDVDIIPSHEAQAGFPGTVGKLNEYDAVILSDIGSNTLLLSPDTFYRGQRSPNKLQALADYDIDKEQSFLVGDSKRDVEAAEAAGVKGYLYTGGNLLDFVKNIVSER